MALKGLTVVEFGGIGPGPFLGMMLADFGADVIVIDRPNAMPPTTRRGKRFVKVDLKNSQDQENVKFLCSKADVLIDPYRPGVMEKLGLGPEVLMKINPRLVYARLTGWGQDGTILFLPGFVVWLSELILWESSWNGQRFLMHFQSKFCGKKSSILFFSSGFFILLVRKRRSFFLTLVRSMEDAELYRKVLVTLVLANFLLRLLFADSGQELMHLWQDMISTTRRYRALCMYAYSNLPLCLPSQQLGRANSIPFPPLNLLADFAGGSLTCAWGIVLCLYEREKSGKGQVIDCAMVDGVLYLSTFVWEGKRNGLFARPRGQNPLDSGKLFNSRDLTKH